ncbi:testis-expressed sequence 10-like protein [Elysia marginata]|uniref:Testis-expressed sequence 10-like protein n=1 Tax=Elysia marginata TaxID=1093978 RepID=A0AAV4GJ04_9GAST|nr:testis-expressed sequence 10-like protein [Elysia marginata]
MPKSKKKKRQDFQKVKLKVGKRLPKGQNVTNLSFKTRQIQLTQRIKEDDRQGLFTKKKENVQDLLRQCDHHSSSSRLAAVMGLRELWLSNHQEMMVSTNVYGYSAVLKKLSGLLIDNEVTVRHAVVNLFKVILNKLARDSAAPLDRLLGGSLFAYLHTFLCCAMNHVHEDVRLDALLLYDVLLDTCPALVVRQTGGLLRNLVGLLAAPSPDHVGSRGDATTQKLSLNPESRLPVKLFRVKVLSRIKQTLMAALNDKVQSSLQSPAVVDNDTVWSLHNDHSDRKREQNTNIASQQVINRFQTMLNGGSHDLDDYITNPTSLQCFMEQCVPVMIQCWKEARADTDTHNESGNLLTSDAMEVISLAVSVMQHLFVLSSYHTKIQKLQQTAAKTLEKLLMAGFPYSAQLEIVPSKKKMKKKLALKGHAGFATKTSVNDLNLAICDIMSCLTTDSSADLNKVWMKKISRYVAVLLRESPSTEQCRTVIRIIQNMFLNPNTAGYFSKVYKAALQCYLRAAPKSQDKKLFYALFAQMGQVWDGWSKTNDDAEPKLTFHYKKSQEVEDILVEFFQSLPQLALAAHSLSDEQWTLSVLRLMRHGHVLQYCTPFAENLGDVLDSSKGLFVSSTEEVQRNVCSLISTGTAFTKENLRQLLHLIRCPPEKPAVHDRKSSSCVNRVLFSMFANIRACVPLASQLDMKQMSQEQHQVLSDYLRFLFSLQIGFTGEELDKLCPVNLNLGQKSRWLDVVFSVSENQWRRHVEISNIVSKEVANFRLSAEPDLGFKYAFTFMDNFEHFWIQTFATREKIHILSVLGLIKLLVQASRPAVKRKPGQEFQSLACAGVAAVLASLYDQEVTSDMPNDIVWQIKTELTHCLASTSGATFLNSVMEFLSKRERGEYGGSERERQAAKSAQDFLLTDEVLRNKLGPSVSA